ncbi:siderophore-interacting protein [Nonomuraea sp. NPDC050451]|uniref:siderophore-interacting protein n=1 Tax=Nonomuraea sp. NPDC050451 TaxID=3364364 RepID=UPI00379CF435
MITLEVVRNTRLSPHFTTVTLGGPALERLRPMGFDQTVRLFFPRDGQIGLRMPTLSNEAWMAQVLLLPKSRRPWVRNYTIRRFRPEAYEVDIEFALHGGTSPASAWALRARPGDPAGIFDMGISYLPPSDAAWHLLVGDESALPAILAILEHAPASLVAEVFLEVPETADIRTDVAHPQGVRIHWLPRDGTATTPGELALETVKRAALPAGRFYTWVAGESRLPTGLRRHLVNDRGTPRGDIAFIGYWRHGRSSPG